MRSDLHFKVQVEHDKDENLKKLGDQIVRQLLKIYGVRKAELSAITTDE